MKKYREKLGTKVEELAKLAGLKGLFRGDFMTYVDKQKTGVRVKLDFVLEPVNDDNMAKWEQLLKEEFGDLFVRVQQNKRTFTHDSAGRYLGGHEVTNVRVRLKDEVREMY